MTSKSESHALHNIISDFQRCIFTKKEKHVNVIPPPLLNTFEITKSQQVLVFISWD